MRKWILIFLAPAVYLLLCSKSCDSGQMDDDVLEKKNLNKTRDFIKTEAESETLSDQSLRAYEANAKQKLNDFADFLSIYYDQNIDSAMKKQAGNMIVKLFSSEEITIPPFIPGVKWTVNPTLTDLLKNENLPEYKSTKILIDSITVREPLRYSGESLSKGTLTFSTRVISYSSSDSLVLERIKMEVEMLAKKVDKTFGSETLRVWGVFLGNMKLAKTD
ncbi:MAG: hypothetical protein FD170_1915 [Bacteroidetes bacterium]|nr:MAG: hypothetical protein FD170_1915 [Bacteroidota bacterium]